MLGDYIKLFALVGFSVNMIIVEGLKINDVFLSLCFMY